jgi:hypothetical protein
METVLMIVTVIALTLAIAMAVLAWRLLRENRERTAARAEALHAMALAESDDRFAELDEGDSGIEHVEHIEQDDPREHATDWDWALAERQPATVETQPVLRPLLSQVAVPVSHPMFGASTAPPRGPGKRWLAFCAVGLVIAGLASAVYTFYGPVIGAEARLAGWTGGERRSGPRPLELLSLRHTADSSGTFTVTGLVQNPSDGATIRKVIAVVYLFDRDGNYFGGGKATLDFDVLQGGAESPFTVRVPNVTHVSRYRVGFRSENDGVVAHVDRRGHPPEGMTSNGLGAATGVQVR